MRNARKVILAVAVLAATLSFTAVLAGCAGTVAPKIVSSAQASWDTNNAGAFAQNSGLLGSDEAGWLVITPHARDRYNALVSTYGTRFSPAIGKDADLLATGTNTFLLAPIGIEHFAAMQRWDRQRRSPNLH